MLRLADCKAIRRHSRPATGLRFHRLCHFLIATGQQECSCQHHEKWTYFEPVCHILSSWNGLLIQNVEKGNVGAYRLLKLHRRGLSGDWTRQVASGSFGYQQRKTTMSQGGDGRSDETLCRRIHNSGSQAVKRQPRMCKDISAIITHSLSFVWIDRRAVTGPCTAEYGPLAAGKKRIAAQQNIIRRANSLLKWREIIKRVPQRPDFGRHRVRLCRQPRGWLISPFQKSLQVILPHCLGGSVRSPRNPAFAPVCPG